MSPEEKLLRAIFSDDVTEEDLDPVYLGDDGVHWFALAPCDELKELGPFDDRPAAQAARDLYFLEHQPTQGNA